MTEAKKLKILVTGGTGFLGKQLVPLLRKKHQVDVISRTDTADIKGDLTLWNAGLDIEKLKQNKYDIFLHMAGLYNLTASQAECYQHNIAGTNTALKIADQLHIPIFMNTSSVAAGINSTLPTVKPYDLNFSRPFPDYYSESKALAEKMVQNWNGHFRARINFRLGVLIGDTVTGSLQRIDGPYHAPIAFDKLRGLIEKSPTKILLPGSNKTKIPLVPVDVAAKAIAHFCDWSQNSQVQGYHSFHITPTEGLALKDLYLQTMKNLFIRNKGVVLFHSLPIALVTKMSRLLMNFPEEELRYILQLPQYDSSETTAILGDRWCPEFSAYEKTFWSGYEKYISNRRN